MKRRNKHEDNTQSCRHDEETTDVKNKVVTPGRIESRELALMLSDAQPNRGTGREPRL